MVSRDFSNLVTKFTKDNNQSVSLLTRLLYRRKECKHEENVSFVFSLVGMPEDKIHTSRNFIFAGEAKPQLGIVYAMPKLIGQIVAVPSAPHNIVLVN